KTVVSLAEFHTTVNITSTQPGRTLQNILCPLQHMWFPHIMKARCFWRWGSEMETKKKVGKTRKPARPEPGGQDGQNNRPWPTLENEVMEKWARNIKKKRNEPGSIPYPFNRE
ncbi:MAG: hypothetical protein OXB89_06475, partial [Anaerolineaceae bacterium]|nr:hypothetical protein [Anaerolineaceae bacterium]